MDAIPTLNVIGAGRVGRSLARLWDQAGVFRIGDVACARPGSAEAACAFIAAGTPAAATETIRPAAFTLITVPDGAIRDCAERAARAGLFRDGDVVFHASGSLASDELAAADACGALVASAHPVRSFADPTRVVAGFAGTWVGMEGQAGAIERLDLAFARIGARSFHIDPKRKALYHAACVAASNHLVTLLDAALSQFTRAGIAPDKAADILHHIAASTLDNVHELGPERALTGPVLRGDIATVRSNLDALAVGEERVLYARLALAALALAIRARGSDERCDANLRELLNAVTGADAEVR